jgi:hypothetical protein
MTAVGPSICTTPRSRFVYLPENVGDVKARPETAIHSDFEVALLPGAVIARVNVVVVGEDP